jgi:hypothetical protein
MTSGASASATKAAPVALASVASMLARPEVRFFRENLRCLLERSRPAQNPRTTFLRRFETLETTGKYKINCALRARSSRLAAGVGRARENHFSLPLIRRSSSLSYPHG